MGDGCIDIRTIRGWVEDAGFRGFNEVEVFSEQYWAMDQTAYLQKIRDAYLRPRLKPMSTHRTFTPRRSRLRPSHSLSRYAGRGRG